MVDVDTVRGWQGATMVDRDGDKVGTIDALYVDDQTGQPEWALVNTGLFGTRSTFVPIATATGSGDDGSGPTTDQAMTRSEEELRVGTQTRERAGPGCAST